MKYPLPKIVANNSLPENVIILSNNNGAVFYDLSTGKIHTVTKDMIEKAADKICKRIKISGIMTNDK